MLLLRLFFFLLCFARKADTNEKSAMIALSFSLFSLTSKLEIEGGQAYAEGLEKWGWVGYVHVEVLGANTAKLHINVVVIVLVDQLKVLDRGLVHAPVEIKHESLYLCNIDYKESKYVWDHFVFIKAWVHLHSFHFGGLLKKNMIFSVLLILNCS